MISPRQLAAAILALKPEGAHHVDIGHRTDAGFPDRWSVTFMNPALVCASENADTLDAALAKARVSFLRKVDDVARNDNLAGAYFGQFFADAEGRN